MTGSPVRIRASAWGKTAHGAARRARHVGRRERRYALVVKITCNGISGPRGNFVATEHGFVPFEESTARDLAHDAMLLALAPEHAERLIEAARTHELVAAGPRPLSSSQLLAASVATS